MDRSCCICGTVLGAEESDLPQWTKSIQGLCWSSTGPVLSDQGSMDDHALPFNLPIPNENALKRFHNVRDPGDATDEFCYPFHSACWTILSQNNGMGSLERNINALYKIFESSHSYRRSLRLGHNYMLESMIEGGQEHGEDIVTKHRSNPAVLRDPSNFQLRKISFKRRIGIERKSHIPSDIFDNLPQEIFWMIMSELTFAEMQLLYNVRGRAIDLSPPELFWKSMFRRDREFGSAQGLLPLSVSYMEQYFTIHFNIQQGSNIIHLRNRKRIWELCSFFNDLISSLARQSEPNLATICGGHTHLCAVSCLALRDDLYGCRELTRVCTSVEDRFCSIAASYTVVFGREVVCGLKFYSDTYGIHDLGYVDDSKLRAVQKVHDQIIWLVCSFHGIQEITTTYPKTYLDTAIKNGESGFALARRCLTSISEVCIGLDAMRIVSIYTKTLDDPTVQDIIWKLPYPSLAPTFHSDNIISLCQAQSRSFIPASYLASDHSFKRLIAIKVYSALAYHAAICGIGFLHENSDEMIWGTTDSAASVVFFLHHTDRLVKVEVYQWEFSACHIQFTTSLGRVSDILPPCTRHSKYDKIEFEVGKEGEIVGFCGIFKGPDQKLSCLGVMSKFEVTTRKQPCTLSQRPAMPTGGPPLVGIRNHGYHQTRLQFHVPYYAVRACVTTTASRYRRVGQVTGLLFYMYKNDNAPRLFGQFTGLGDLYVFDNNEVITDVDVSMTSPNVLDAPQAGLNKIVESLELVTNCQRIKWDPKRNTASIALCNNAPHGKQFAIWEFNAMFDRISCI